MLGKYCSGWNKRAGILKIYNQFLNLHSNELKLDAHTDVTPNVGMNEFTEFTLTRGTFGAAWSGTNWGPSAAFGVFQFTKGHFFEENAF